MKQQISLVQQLDLFRQRLEWLFALVHQDACAVVPASPLRIPRREHILCSKMCSSRNSTACMVWSRRRHQPMVHFPRMDTRIARRLMQKKKRLDAYGPLPPLTVERIHEDLRVLLTYHSNAIEGNTLPLAETQMVLAYGITVNEHPCSFIEGKKRSYHLFCQRDVPRGRSSFIGGDCIQCLFSVGRTYLPNLHF